MSSNQLVSWFWMQDRVTKQLVPLPSLILELSARPSHPLQCWKLGAYPQVPQTSAFLKLRPSWAQLGTWGCVIGIKTFISFYLFNISFRHDFAPQPCRVLFMLMFAYVNIIKIYFHIFFGNFVFLFLVLMFLILNHIILSCSLFRSQTQTFPLTFILVVFHVLNTGNLSKDDFFL